MNAVMDVYERNLERLLELVAMKKRFTYDLRSQCQVYSGVVCAYRATKDSDHFLELPAVLDHALANDGIVGVWTDQKDGRTYYDSCRLFTDVPNAIRFAIHEKQ